MRSLRSRITTQTAGMDDVSNLTKAIIFAVTVALGAIYRVSDATRRNRDDIAALREKLPEKYVTSKQLDQMMRLHLAPIRAALAGLSGHKLSPAPPPPEEEEEETT